MKPLDIGFAGLICFIWALNLVISRWVMTEFDVAPVFLAAARFLGLAVVLIPFLWPLPRHWGRLFLVAMGVGGLHFALMFMGLERAGVSEAVVVTQINIPITAALGAVFLGEVIDFRRALGMTLVVSGAVLIAIDPNDFSVSSGLVLVAGAILVACIARIIMKKMEAISALRLQAWVGLYSFLPLFVLSYALEGEQASTFHAAGWPAYAATAFSIFGVSILGHGGHYTLIKKYDVSLIAPLMVMTPIWGVILGVTLLGEPFTLKLLFGGALALAGVWTVTAGAALNAPVSLSGAAKNKDPV